MGRRRCGRSPQRRLIGLIRSDQCRQGHGAVAGQGGGAMLRELLGNLAHEPAPPVLVLGTVPAPQHQQGHSGAARAARSLSCLSSGQEPVLRR